ncbi:RNase H2 complex component [Teratosphaeria destructans]|uniref:Ribonuclease H2 subunit B n=1 Tax=Teratosphaeria destructans TaxID=418781 RepID=A0A9W7SVY8_9PEZI|nr:RNase H2 complex component [Teratosphaeria destructans]
MKTRSKRTAPSKPEAEDVPKAVLPTLEPSETNPPKLFILPKDASHDSRIVTLPNSATLTPTRYFVDPEKGFYEFTRIAGPKKAQRSWLLAPDRTEDEAADEGYVLQSPDLFVATAIDPLFLALSTLSTRDGGKEWGTLHDRLFLDDAADKYNHLQSLMRCEGSILEMKLEQRMRDVCKQMGDGDDAFYTLDEEKLVRVIHEKAVNMVKTGLPASMEERFVKQALVMPELSLKREESSVSIIEDAGAGAESQDSGCTETSEDSRASAATIASVSTAVTSVTVTPVNELRADEATQLLRLRTALNYILINYIPPKLRAHLQIIYNDGTKQNLVDFTLLDERLAKINKAKSEAQALRSISDNISRKRGQLDDDEAMEKAASKKQKQEEEDAKKKNMSQGVKKLMKADTSGMKKLSSFFTKAPPKK